MPIITNKNHYGIQQPRVLYNHSANYSSKYASVSTATVCSVGDNGHLEVRQTVWSVCPHNFRLRVGDVCRQQGKVYETHCD